MGTIITGTVLVLIVTLVIGKMIKDKKNGKSLQCGCNCSECNIGCNVKKK